MTATPAYFLTRQAALDLRGIHAYSKRKWGQQVADTYIRALYAAIQGAAARPDQGRLRQQRSTPFLMVPARRHFIIYDTLAAGIVILTIQNQVRDIESLIAELTPAFLVAIERLRRQ